MAIITAQNSEHAPNPTTENTDPTQYSTGRKWLIQALNEIPHS